MYKINKLLKFNIKIYKPLKKERTVSGRWRNHNICIYTSSYYNYFSTYVDFFHELSHNISDSLRYNYGASFIKRVRNVIYKKLEDKYTIKLINSTIKNKERKDYLLNKEEIFARLLSDYFIYVSYKKLGLYKKIIEIDGGFEYSIKNIENKKIQPYYYSFTEEELILCSDILIRILKLLQ